jgi:hypothetical protein
MKRLISSFLAIAMCLALGAVASASPMTGASAAHKTTHSCPKGQTWVKSYMRAGKTVKGYCRKR